MDTTKIIKGVVGSGRYTVTAPIVKEDYGLFLQIEGVELPSTYEVDFSNSEHNGTSVTMIGNSDGVLIPHQFIDTGKDIFAFLYHVGEDFGRTLYTIRIPNKLRPDRTNEAPTPEEQSVIDQAISALNTAVAKTAQDVISADQSARSASGDADRAEQAKTGAETAQGKAEEAKDDAERAKDDAETSERNAAESERNAKGYSETASEKADSIHSMTAYAQTLPAGSSASASYDAETGVMSFGIPKGKDGTDGDDGYSPTANVSKSGKTATITITDKNGTTTAQVEDGTDGTDGIDGISPSVSVTDITGGHRVVITDKDGAKSFDVEDGATGATPNLTIGTVETLEPTESATATITGTPENPVLNLGIPQGDAGEVTTEEFLKAFPTDTASGSIASFSDGADDLPLKSLVVNIDPIQDLHGQDAPYPAGGGKNKFDADAWITLSRNNMYYSVTDEDVSVIADDVGGLLGRFIQLAPNTQYTISFKNATSGRVFDDTATTLVQFNNSQTSATFTTTESGQIAIKFYGTTYPHVVGKVQIELGSTATSWSPYENLCPISGHTQAVVTRTGVNVWDEEWEVGGIDASTGADVVATDRIRSKNYIPVIPSTAYYFKASNTIGIRLYDADKNYINSTVQTNLVYVIPSDVRFIRFIVLNTTTYNHDISINYPSTDTDYHPYSGQSITIPLGQTVYGGTLDVLSGELVIDRAMVDLGTLAWTGNGTNSVYTPMLTNKLIGGDNCVCSALAKVAQGTQVNSMSDATFKTYANGVDVAVKLSGITNQNAQTMLSGFQFVYPLVTPITVTLTPNELSTLLGANNIWSDAGEVTAEYRADPTLYIQRLTKPDADMVADSNITSGSYFMVGNTLYKATANIASGATISPNVNCTRKSLSEALNELNS